MGTFKQTESMQSNVVIKYNTSKPMQLSYIQYTSSHSLLLEYISGQYTH